MKKSLLSCILSFALLLSLLPATVLAAEPSLKVSATSVNAGDEVTVTYTVPNEVVAGSVSLEIYFDTAYFQVKSIVPATITDASSSTSEPATSSTIGKVTMAALNMVGDPFTIPAGTVLVTIVFVAKAGSGGSSSITVGTDADIIKAVDDSNLDIAAGVDNTPAAITVNAAPPAPVTLSGISVKTAPDKVNYTEGEMFDATGMVIEATYSDSSTAAVTSYTYAPTAALTTTDTEVTISYTEGGVTKTCTQAITVNAAPPAPVTLSGISVKTAPDKVTYTEGELFDATGMVIEATYSDSSKKDVTSYTYAPTAALTTSDTEVTISYTEGGVTKTCTQAITVNAAPPAPVEYTVTFHVNGGSGTIPPQTTSGQKLASLPTASRAGYRFDGWYTAASGGSEITTAHVYAANTTLYAHWTSVGGSTGGKTSRYSGPSAIDMPMLYRGCTGDAVKTLQGELNAKGYDCGSVDGIFGGKTYAAVTAFQKANSLSVDGIVGKLTWGKLYDAAPVTAVTAAQPTVSYGSSGEAVRKLQELLNAKGYDCGSVDGIFGAKTKAAVQAFQEANSLASDGIAGPLTWSKLG